MTRASSAATERRRGRPARPSRRRRSGDAAAGPASRRAAVSAPIRSPDSRPGSPWTLPLPRFLPASAPRGAISPPACAVPRRSKAEGPARPVAGLGRGGAWRRIDAAGNLVVRKPASPGREGRQGDPAGPPRHGVPENSDSGHDFSAIPFRPRCRDGWLVAEATAWGPTTASASLVAGRSRG